MPEPIKLTEEDFTNLVRQADVSDRKRAALSLHDANYHGPRVLVNCIRKDSYVRPHMHPTTTGEIWVPLSGRIGVVLFDNKGKVEKTHVLERGGLELIDIPGNTYHTAVALDSHSIMFEVSQGPYDSENYKKFPDWSPAEGDAKSITYLENLRELFR